MTPTAENRSLVRKYIDEKIPATGTDADTKFLDSEIDSTLEAVESVYAAAAELWIQKAGLYQSEMQDVVSLGLGDVKETRTSLRERQDYAFLMAQKYTELARSRSTKVGSFRLTLTPPEVL
jgi:hypothetical protein